MDKKTRTLVWQRADGICEYCRLWQEHEPFIQFQVEHIIPTKHGGSDDLGNLALACYFCNSHKSSNLSGIDPKTKRIVRLFNPRRQRWERHFRWNGITIVGKTPLGRATVVVFGMNLYCTRSGLTHSLARSASKGCPWLPLLALRASEANVSFPPERSIPNRLALRETLLDLGQWPYHSN